MQSFDESIEYFRCRASEFNARENGRHISLAFVKVRYIWRYMDYAVPVVEVTTNLFKYSVWQAHLSKSNSKGCFIRFLALSQALKIDAIVFDECLYKWDSRPQCLIPDLTCNITVFGLLSQELF